MAPETPASHQPDADPLALMTHWSQLSGKAAQLVSEFWVRQMAKAPPAGAPPALDAPPSLDPMGVMKAWMDVGQGLMKDPAKLAAVQQSWWSGQMQLWQGIMQPDAVLPSVANAPKSDKRFNAEAWTQNRIFDFIKQNYLLTVQITNQMYSQTNDVDPHTKAKAEFFTKQLLDALSPSNFLATNPQALQATVDSKGENLLHGLENMLKDIEAGRISMTDYTAFEVGRNVAITPGHVVFENSLFQLLQFNATTDKVHETPILFFPPWINKYYILDLTTEKSMIRWLTDQGFTVFVVSWVNPGSEHRDTTLDDYMRDGQLAAIEAVRQAAKVEAIHAVGYCISGTLLSATLAHLHKLGQQDRIKSATFFTAQVDFSEAGDLCVFVDDVQLAQIEKMVAEKGYLDANYMAQSFNMLRSNDLIWSYVVNNYLLGKTPFPFDLLYWNGDSTRMPAATHLYYLRNMYRDNLLVVPNALTLNGTPIDLTTVKTPTFIQAGREDHIAPAKSVYKMTQHFSGPMTFCLAGSGHIAGVVNPPSMKKYQYWTNAKLEKKYDDFVAGATEHPGSWWPMWEKWLAPQSGKKVAARIPKGLNGFVGEPAPGSYVKVK
jgi:polyhydroxyalkanoate synthase subunit PhaC